MKTNYFIIPGLGGSGSDHWQTRFEETQPNFQRIQQKNWDEPDMDEWVERIENAIAGFDLESIVFVAHSLGCLTVAEWSKRYSRRIKGALLVAPPDADLLQQKLNRKLFEQTPAEKLNFKTVVVASANDHWVTIDKAKSYAENWGGSFINIGDAGHINNLSGFGEWEQGLDILKELVG